MPSMCIDECNSLSCGHLHHYGFIFFFLAGRLEINCFFPLAAGEGKVWVALGKSIFLAIARAVERRQPAQGLVPTMVIVSIQWFFSLYCWSINNI